MRSFWFRLVAIELLIETTKCTVAKYTYPGEFGDNESNPSRYVVFVKVQFCLNTPDS